MKMKYIVFITSENDNIEMIDINTFTLASQHKYYHIRHTLTLYSWKKRDKDMYTCLIENTLFIELEYVNSLFMQQISISAH